MIQPFLKHYTFQMRHLWLCLVLGVVATDSNLNTSEKKDDKEDELLLVQVVSSCLRFIELYFKNQK